MFQDPLQHLPLERWPDLQRVFKNNWPRSRIGYAVLETQKRLMEQGIDYGFKVYCPFGEVQNGMVAVNIKDDFYELIVLCPHDDTENLEAALRKTKLVDWNRSIVVPFVPNNVLECIKKVIHVADVEIGLILPSKQFILDRKTSQFDVNIPENITFAHLTLDHLDIVNSTWPHRYPTSSWYFRLLINAKHGYGLFSNNSLICWVLINESGALCHMYTPEEHRKKGYAELILKIVSNIMLSDNRDVCAFCLRDNIKACNLYRKIGFVESEGVVWCYLHSKVK